MADIFLFLMAHLNRLLVVALMVMVLVKLTLLAVAGS
jgi:hypothetical protein